MTDTPLNIVVLSGGISHERDVSLRSGRRVADALGGYGAKVQLRDPDANLIHWLQKTTPDVVWPALHGASGEDGSLRRLLEFLGIPFVGSRSDSAQLAWDKSIAKIIVERNGVATPKSITLPRDVFRELGADTVFAAISTDLPVPLVVKPVKGGSAQGVTLVNEASDLSRAMVDAYTYGDIALVEQRIQGIEIAIGIIDTGDGSIALPAVEIDPLSGVYSFEARYNAGETRFYIPARLDDHHAQQAREAALTAHRALGMRHLSRIDLIVDRAGKPWFLEANVLPGLTETSLVPQALTAAGYDLGWVYASLAHDAILSPQTDPDQSR